LLPPVSLRKRSTTPTEATMVKAVPMSKFEEEPLNACYEAMEKRLKASDWG